MGLEYRQFEFECRALEDSQDGYFRFEGILSMYGNENDHGEVFLPGAFSESLSQRDPVAFWMHEEPIGIFERVEDTQTSLKVFGKCPLSDSFVSGRVKPQVSIGSVKQMSVGFRRLKWQDEEDENGRIVRYISKAGLYEGSLVPFGSDNKADVLNHRSFINSERIGEINTRRDIERVLRDSGAFSRRAATYLASCLDESKMRGEHREIDLISFDAAIAEMRKLNHDLKG
jgi:HK97 family phage prohead protease